MTSPEGPAVEALRLTLESLALMEIDADRVCLVVNHVGGTGTAGAGGRARRTRRTTRVCP